MKQTSSFSSNHLFILSIAAMLVMASGCIFRPHRRTRVAVRGPKVAVRTPAVRVHTPAHVVVRTRPPARRQVRRTRPNRPGRSSVWVAGHWRWQSGRWVWVAGRWHRNRRTQVWQAPVYRTTANGQVEYYDGYWHDANEAPTGVYVEAKPSTTTVHAGTVYTTSSEPTVVVPGRTTVTRNAPARTTTRTTTTVTRNRPTRVGAGTTTVTRNTTTGRTRVTAGTTRVTTGTTRVTTGTTTVKPATGTVVRTRTATVAGPGRQSTIVRPRTVHGRVVTAKPTTTVTAQPRPGTVITTSRRTTVTAANQGATTVNAAPISCRAPSGTMSAGRMALIKGHGLDHRANIVKIGGRVHKIHKRANKEMTILVPVGTRSGVLTVERGDFVANCGLIRIR